MRDQTLTTEKSNSSESDEKEAFAQDRAGKLGTRDKVLRCDPGTVGKASSSSNFDSVLSARGKVQGPSPAPCKISSSAAVFSAGLSGYGDVAVFSLVEYSERHCLRPVKVPSRESTLCSDARLLFAVFIVSLADSRGLAEAGKELLKKRDQAATSWTNPTHLGGCIINVMKSSLPAVANKRILPYSRAPYLPIHVAYAKVGSLGKSNGPAVLGVKKKGTLVNKGLPLFEVSAGVRDVGHSAARCREPGLDLSTQATTLAIFHDVLNNWTATQLWLKTMSS
ncbi:uncharacterized protein CLUP02_03795 [Colletotrichum lupini]|uniref:Uncharacterized protein n=1 Tax=Colletotrichum lupini TaxID=145971 RepID=A0A9Q8SJJ7_9PEZI|nr:uncharacterized protein CLUP02_03795 [Colletotrichum lupini]UQC78318.1 hypothetical protein CLUP02_03795 [Colletotrichum lupini]